MVKKNFRKRCLFLFSFLVFAGLITAGRVFADGLIIVPRPPAPLPHPQTPFPLEVKYHHVEVDITGQVAKTSIDQEFYNPTDYRLEGIYFFPIPDGAAINNFSMDIDGRMVTAELLPADKARGIYEDIVRKMRDPALLEYSGRQAFKMRIFPIEPRSGKRIKISYTQPLRADSGLVNYVYPLNTEKFSARPLKEVSIRVNLKVSGKIKTIFCPTHQVEIRRYGDHSATIGFEERNVKPDTDFSLYYDTQEKGVGLSLLTYRPSVEDGFFFLAVAPSFDAAGEIVSKDVTLVFDTSGSMAGKKMEQAKAALLFCLENLNQNDRFEMVRFSTEAEPLFGGLKTASRENISRAKEFVRGLKPVGGTNIEEALARALEANRNPDGRPKFIIFLTDGKPTIGATDEQALIEKVKQINHDKIRIFTFGVGDDVNTHLLDRLTEETRGVRTYVRPGEDLELKVSGFYEKVRSPVLVDLKLRFGSGIRILKMHPQELPDLFKGDQLLIFGRYQGSGETGITLSGTAEGRSRSFDYRVTFPERSPENEFIAPLWAAQRIGYLLDQARLHGGDNELKEEITELARQYGIITPYTSYLIIEDETNRVARNELAADRQTLGAVSPAAPSLVKQVREEYAAMSRKSGSASVTASQEVDALKNARNLKEINQGASRLNYTGPAGRQNNLASQTKNVAGRAFYQTGNYWVDSNIQQVKNQRVRRIQLASSEYFQLIEQEPASAQFLALGKNIRFALKGTIYEIYE